MATSAPVVPFPTDIHLLLNHLLLSDLQNSSLSWNFICFSAFQCFTHKLETLHTGSPHRSHELADLSLSTVRLAPFSNEVAFRRRQNRSQRSTLSHQVTNRTFSSILGTVSQQDGRFHCVPGGKCSENTSICPSRCIRPSTSNQLCMLARMAS